jgi:AhpD family alkylhydroperoxidase
MSARIPLPSEDMDALGVPDTASFFPVARAKALDLFGALASLHHLDPVTMELVRMRNARHQRCRLCMSLRSREALDAGVDEDMLEQVEHHQDSALTDRQKAALRLADAFLSASRPTAELTAEVQAHYSSIEIVELVLRLLHWNSNKVMVALGLDGEETEIRTY